jgi:hypothetical protein
MVIETSRPIAQVARELGIGVQTLGTGSARTGETTQATTQPWDSTSECNSKSSNGKPGNSKWRTSS